jgi:5-methylcytosine-specific restriction endonuclease McrA
MRQTQLYKELGYAGIYEYAEAEFGFAPGKTQQLSRAGEQLKELPHLDRALAEGALGWTKVRTLARVATRSTEEEWIQLAAEKSSRELEELASSSLPGDTPPEPDDEDLEELEYAWATIRFEKHHYEQLMRAAVRIRTRLGDPDLSLSQLLLTLAERELERGHEEEVVAAPRGENAFREQYRIIEHRCPECDRAWTEGRGGRQELPRQTRELAECDAEVVQGDSNHEKAGHVSRTIPPAVRRAVLVRDDGKCQVPGCRNHRYLDLHHIEHRQHGGDHHPDNLTVVCSTHHDLLHRDVLTVEKNADGSLSWTRGGGEPLAILLRIGRDHAELGHEDLSEFDGEPGKWCLLDKSDESRRHVSAKVDGYPAGSQAFYQGDGSRPGIGFEGTRLPSR